MAKRYVDIASFECRVCGHRSTPPAAINSIPHQMEIVGEIPVKAAPDLTDAQIKEGVETMHPGNTVFVTTRYKSDPDNESKTVADAKVVTMARSYCEIGMQTATSLEESDHIRFDCPNCHNVLYEVTW
jgi:predicted RNA-binding Zn-ribbon protein involved in translation (DUF1610 family)